MRREEKAYPSPFRQLSEKILCISNIMNGAFAPMECSGGGGGGGGTLIVEQTVTFVLFFPQHVFPLLSLCGLSLTSAHRTWLLFGNLFAWCFCECVCVSTTTLCLPLVIVFICTFIGCRVFFSFSLLHIKVLRLVYFISFTCTLAFRRKK